MSEDTFKFIELTKNGDGLVATPRGEWVLHQIVPIVEQLRSISHPEPCHVMLDGKELQRIDTVGALALLRFLRVVPRIGEQLQERPPEIALRNFKLEQENVLALIRTGVTAPDTLRECQRRFLGRIGHTVTELLSDLAQLFRFIGESAVEVLQVLTHPRRLRWNEMVTQIEQCFVNAIPVTALVMLLIGIVISYLFGQQIEKYGANLLVVDAVSIAICRELSPVIVAIIVAGRSGSAFTAQLGAMKLNEEIDAIVTLGLSASRVLILPRLIALVLTLPLLVFVGDVVGIIGGSIIAEFRLGIMSSTYISRLHSVLSARHFFVGIVKAPVFAAFIAIIGCKMGMTTASDAKSIGESTTSTVVQSIVAVILVNAAFAIIFAELKI